MDERHDIEWPMRVIMDERVAAELKAYLEREHITMGAWVGRAAEMRWERDGKKMRGER